MSSCYGLPIWNYLVYNLHRGQNYWMLIGWQRRQYSLIEGKITCSWFVNHQNFSLAIGWAHHSHCIQLAWQDFEENLQMKRLHVLPEFFLYKKGRKSDDTYERNSILGEFCQTGSNKKIICVKTWKSFKLTVVSC